MKTTKIKDFITKIKTPLFVFFREMMHLIIGFSLIFGILYLRFLPRISRDLYDNMTNTRILLTCFSLACIVFHIYYTLKILNVIKTKEPTGIKKYIITVCKNFGDYLIGTLINVYRFCWYWTEDIVDRVTKKKSLLKYHTMRPIARFFMRESTTLFYTYILICLKFVPRIVFLSIFFTEAFFYQHLNLTFKCIPFLLIIYLERFVIFTLEDFHEHYNDRVKSFLEFQDVDNDPEDFMFRFRPSVNPENIPYGAKDLDDYCFEHFYIIQSLPQIIEEYKEYRDHVFSGYYITLFLHSVRLQIYLFILLYGLNLFS